MILQDPMTSLNPVFTVGEQVSWPIRLHQNLDRNKVWDKVIEMLTLVKIPSPEVRIKGVPPSDEWRNESEDRGGHGFELPA